MLDPLIWEDPDFGVLKVEERLLFIGLLSHADDEGLGDANPKVLRRAVFGFDAEVSEKDVEEWLASIQKQMRNVVLYEADGRRYYYLRNWKKYQRLHSPTPTRFPLPPDLKSSEVPGSSQDGYVRVMEKWSNAMPGMITTAIANELYEMINDWEKHASSLPEGSAEKKLSGSEVLVEAIAEAVRSTGRPNLRYVKAILMSWIANGYKARRKTKEVEVAKKLTLTAEDVKVAKSKRSKR